MARVSASVEAKGLSTEPEMPFFKKGVEIAKMTIRRHHRSADQNTNPTPSRNN